MTAVSSDFGRVRWSDAELPGDGAHVQLADVARVALLALLGVEDGAAAVGVDAEPHTEVARVQLAGEMACTRARARATRQCNGNVELVAGW